MRLWNAVFLIVVLYLLACDTIPKELPILGHKKEVDGVVEYHTIPDFSFYNQDSVEVNNATFAKKAYVVDFFFTSCPTICPKVTQQMRRIYSEFEDEDRLALLSYTIDPKRDSVGRLKKYATDLDVSSDRWHFVTGQKEKLHGIAEDYFSVVVEDKYAPGGFDHSGRLILVDENRHVRAFCDGTNEEDVNRFMKEIKVLLAEKKGSSAG